MRTPTATSRIFEDVVSLISNNYVEDVDLEEVIGGALRGLTEGLDAESAYLSREDVDRIRSGRALPAGGIGVEVRRRYYVQVVAPADGSAAARAGLLPGDFIRAIDGEPTRFMSGIEGQRRLRGEPGSTVTVSLIRGSIQEPYDVELVRERSVVAGVSERMAADGAGYVRVAGFDPGTADALAGAVERLATDGASRVILDLRNNAIGRLRRSAGRGTALHCGRHPRHPAGARRRTDSAGGGRARRRRHRHACRTPDQLRHGRARGTVRGGPG